MSSSGDEYNNQCDNKFRESSIVPSKPGSHVLEPCTWAPWGGCAVGSPVECTAAQVTYVPTALPRDLDHPDAATAVQAAAEAQGALYADKGACKLETRWRPARSCALILAESILALTPYSMLHAPCVLLRAPSIAVCCPLHSLLHPLSCIPTHGCPPPTPHTHTAVRPHTLATAELYERVTHVDQGQVSAIAEADSEGHSTAAAGGKAGGGDGEGEGGGGGLVAVAMVAVAVGACYVAWRRAKKAKEAKEEAMRDEEGGGGGAGAASATRRRKSREREVKAADGGEEEESGSEEGDEEARGAGAGARSSEEEEEGEGHVKKGGRTKKKGKERYVKHQDAAEDMEL